MAQRYRFTCPVCEECIVVDRHVREALLAQGCVVCSSSVGSDCFDAR
ncbi:DUF7560 family zinc ribbon protein [Halorussus rarus]